MIWKKSLAILATGLALSAWSPTLVAEASAAERDGVMEVLRDVEIEMAAISDHAAKLDQMVEMPNLYPFSAYRFEWNGIETRFNEAGELVPKLQNASGANEGWKKEVIDEIASLIKAMKVQIEAGMTHLNEVDNVERLYAHDLYEIRISSIEHYADHIDALIEDIENRAMMSSSS